MERSIGRITECPLCGASNETIATCFCACAQRLRVVSEGVRAGQFCQDDLMSDDDSRIRFVCWLIEHGKLSR